MNLKSIFKKVGLGAAEVGATAANAATGGILSPFTSTAVNILKSKLSDPAVVASVDQAATAAAPELETAEMEHAEKLIQLANQDRASARSLPKDFIMVFLAVTTTLCFFGSMFFLALHPIPAVNSEIVKELAVASGAGWMMVMTYKFGASSSGDQALSHLASIAKGQTS